ncbi:MAG: LuxR C-terminal-related transcriptional regulator [Leptolyngbyaceae cyanobacterium HOT.MB2.61]|jgi:DNA-binding CsgD family transcriptional regulator|nr:LuxR C-terminal-related transcriptional regulator [Leptolyngbyaceae cyanobacterium HOT.MB2.61]
MTAYLFSVPLESTSISSLFCPQSSISTRSARSHRRTSSRLSTRQSLDKPARTHPAENFDLTSIWGGLIESLQEGVIVVSPNLKPIYWNLKAKELCKGLSEIDLSFFELPMVVSEVCHRLIRGNRPVNQPLVLECQTTYGHTVRISARWFYPGVFYSGNGKMLDADVGHSSADASELEQRSHRYILVLLKNCTASLQQELRIEQKKYDLTDREAEIWMLLRQEYTYQEIAKMLQISLNTVKTHVKNVYAKRRSFQGQEKFWCSE